LKIFWSSFSISTIDFYYFIFMYWSFKKLFWISFYILSS